MPVASTLPLRTGQSQGGEMVEIEIDNETMRLLEAIDNADAIAAAIQTAAFDSAESLLT